MKEQMHTPGPWEVDENGLAGYGDNGCNFYIVRSGESRYGATIASLSLIHQLLDCGETPAYKTARADAHLMAAAPDLLAALEQARKYLKRVPFNVAQEIDAAIAKAKATGG